MFYDNIRPQFSARPTKIPVLPVGVAKNQARKGEMCFCFIYLFFGDKILNIVQLVGVGILSRFSVFCSAFFQCYRQFSFQTLRYRQSVFAVEYIFGVIVFFLHILTRSIYFHSRLILMTNYLLLKLLKIVSFNYDSVKLSHNNLATWPSTVY